MRTTVYSKLHTVHCTVSMPAIQQKSCSQIKSHWKRKGLVQNTYFQHKSFRSLLLLYFTYLITDEFRMKTIWVCCQQTCPCLLIWFLLWSLMINLILFRNTINQIYQKYDSAKGGHIIILKPAVPILKKGKVLYNGLVYLLASKFYSVSVPHPPITPLHKKCNHCHSNFYQPHPLSHPLNLVGTIYLV